MVIGYYWTATTLLSVGFAEELAEVNRSCRRCLQKQAKVSKSKQKCLQMLAEDSGMY
jgi:hypothetical protein